MNFKDLARAKVNEPLSRSLNSTIYSPTSPVGDLVQCLNSELESPNLQFLIETVKEYHGTLECFYGYLFEPFGGLDNLVPKLQKTRKSRSPYFCLKIPIKNMGCVFLIPLEDKSKDKYVLILKPQRNLQIGIEVKKVLIPGASLMVLTPPYQDLMIYLTQWAVGREAFSRKSL